MTEESISHIALQHSSNINVLFEQFHEFQQIMADHLSIYQELLQLSSEVVARDFKRCSEDPLAKRWIATAGLLLEYAPFHDPRNNAFKATIEKAHQVAVQSLSSQCKQHRSQDD